jgi:serine/threonine protein kinase
MASVYLGEHTIGRRVAIKILHPEVAADAELRGRFEQEARAVNRFHHPAAVEIVDIDVTSDGVPFLVMELLEGSSLQGLLDQGQVPGFDRLLQLMNELLDVLVAAHAVGIIHRDIKPDNLFVQQNGRLKVLDFGIARIRTEGGPSRGATRTGTTIGTVAFMAPEQAVGRSDLDVRADVFSVGATMFRVLTGRHVHEAPGQFQMMMMAAMNPAPALASMLPGAPVEVALVVDRALAFDRDHRYPDARTMQDDVRALLRRERPPHATALATGAPGVAGPTGVFPSPPPPHAGPISFSPPHAGPISHSQIMGPTSYASPGPAPAAPTFAAPTFAAPTFAALGPTSLAPSPVNQATPPLSAQPTALPYSAPPASSAQPSSLAQPPSPAQPPYGALTGYPAGPVPAATAAFAAPVAHPTQAAAPRFAGPLGEPLPSPLIPPVSAARPAKSKGPMYLLGAGALFLLLLGAFVLGASRGTSGPGGKEAGPEASGGAAGAGSPGAGSPGVGSPVATAAGPTGKSPAAQGMPTMTAPQTTMAPTVTWPSWGGPGPAGNGPPPGKEKGKKKGKGD